MATETITKETARLAISTEPVPHLVDTLVSVRTGKIRRLHDTTLRSAIYKDPHHDRVYVTKTGLTGDEQQYEHHGGVDKALHHYCASHYELWKQDCPESAHRFTVGGFGENFVSYNLNENNLCIGDVFQVGDQGVRISVCEPRQPCYKLNHRFEVRDMSRRSQNTGRTGWYYRVLQEGWIKAGDQMVLIERRNPKWSLSNVQKYLHHEKHNTEAMEELVDILELGDEIRGIFRNRLKQEIENENNRLIGTQEASIVSRWSDWRIVSKTRETSTIYSFVVEAIDAQPNAAMVPPGSHVLLKFGKEKKTIRAYSIVSGTTSRLEIGVALSQTSRGGSTYLHSQTKPGDTLYLAPITTSFPPIATASSSKPLHHILLAGGIGLTALLPMAQHFQQTNQSYELHILIRDPSALPFEALVSALPKPNVHMHISSLNQRLDIHKFISSISSATTEPHLYICGPNSLYDAANNTISTLSPSPIPQSHVHTESFNPAPLVSSNNTEFNVTIASRAKSNTPSPNSCVSSLTVPANKTLLDILRDAGFEDSGAVSSGCEAGSCGSCWVGVLDEEAGSDEIDYRGAGGVERERDGKKGMLSCVSRAKKEGGRIVLDL